MSNSSREFHNQVAVPVPVRQTYDYLSVVPIKPGTRVVVPFSRRKLIGVVLSNLISAADLKLKSVSEVLDPRPTLDGEMLELLQWAARYYHYPIGEVLSSAIPVWLRVARQPHNPVEETMYRRVADLEITIVNKSLDRAPKQKLLYGLISSNDWNSVDQIQACAESEDIIGRVNLRQILTALVKKGLVESQKQAPQPPSMGHKPFEATLTPEQQRAIDAITASPNSFSTHLLHGITGSGKTEVYLHIAESFINRGKQALVLVPEIALTPQLVARFTERFAQGVCTIHSNMTDQQRYRTWWKAKTGSATVVLGTRSAIFTPLKNPGIIIVDEEHDLSYKQQDGFRYHARDLAIKRASLGVIPVVLGSATPSMESMRNAESAKFHGLKLNHRIGLANLPEVELVDTRVFPLHEGISAPLSAAIRQGLEQRQQTILYINRRGFAPVAQCGNCNWQARCDRCDAFLTFHKKTGTFRCHHCSKIVKAGATCPECDQVIFYAGIGTQRVEKVLAEQFPEARISRFDRDEITTQNKLEHALEQINQGKVDIVIGTQLISKGHDFPGVTLVGVINPDQGLYSIDFRAPEYLFQQLVQVAGRAGRSSNAGKVIIQTAHPDNPYLSLIQNHDFEPFYRYCARERKPVRLPPFGYLVLWRAESTSETAALKFLQFTSQIGRTHLKAKQLSCIMIMDPVSSPMEKLAGRYRAQLLVKAINRKPLHDLVSGWIKEIEQSPKSRKVRWSIDIDPMDMF